MLRFSEKTISISQKLFRLIVLAKYLLSVKCISPVDMEHIKAFDIPLLATIGGDLYSYF